jgi:hypothetical protein
MRTWLLIFVILMMALGIGLIERRGDFMRPQSGSQDAEFTLFDQEGKQIKLNPHGGHNVLLLFLSLHCDLCRDISKRLQVINTAKSENLDIYPLFIEASDSVQSNEVTAGYTVLSVSPLTLVYNRIAEIPYVILLA